MSTCHPETSHAVVTASGREPAGLPAGFPPFIARRGLANPHLQTIVANYFPRPAFRLSSVADTVEVDPADGSRVLCHCHWQPEPVRAARLTVILVHGLEGSSDSRYVRAIAVRAFAAGCNVVRMNMRNCGGAEHLSPTLYHSGLSGDVDAVMRDVAREKDLRSVALVGYSMGGNLVLKLAGELGEAAPGYLKAVVGVSPAMDLAASADALHAPGNRIYEWKFLAGLVRRFRRKARLFPARYSERELRGIRSLRQFDDRITAPHSGFTGADDYYHRAASSRVAHRIAVPALILHALDDPFVKMLPPTREALAANPHVSLVETAGGGHCSFLAPADGYDGYWAERRLLEFALGRHRS